MRLLLRLTLSSVVVLSLCCAAALVIGHQQPLPARVSILHLADCAVPCWLWIQPGKTTLKEAEQRLFNAYRGESIQTTVSVPGKLMSYSISLMGARLPQIAVTFVGSPIDSIIVVPISDPSWGKLSLGDLLTAYGAPSGIANDRSLYVLMGTPPEQLLIPIAVSAYASSRPKTRLLIDEPVGSLMFYYKADQQFYSRWKPWQGFSVLQPRYLTFVIP